MAVLSQVKNASAASNMSITLGSALLERGRIVSTGYNYNNRSQWRGITVPAIHAEMHATRLLTPRYRPINYSKLQNS